MRLCQGRLDPQTEQNALVKRSASGGWKAFTRSSPFVKRKPSSGTKRLLAKAAPRLLRQREQWQ
jgi:hypothetical protein